MHAKKVICSCLLAAGILTAAFTLAQVQNENRGVIRADGGMPQPPPDPWTLRA